MVNRAASLMMVDDREIVSTKKVLMKNPVT
jgi:hypothetical protein